MSSTKCSVCGLVNWTSAKNCKRCGTALGVSRADSSPARERSQEEKEQVRRSALNKIKSGAAATVLFVVALFAIPLTGHQFSFKPATLVLALMPVAWLLAGVLQLVTKTPFEELSERWDNLAWWQRGLIGISVFAGGLIIVLAVAFAIIRIFFW